tara:strand:- start:297 stop:413 length:117 start_codon:yes stop_codon:yes gene_type:complete
MAVAVPLHALALSTDTTTASTTDMPEPATGHGAAKFGR